MGKVYSSEGCADAMVADGERADAAYSMDRNAIIEECAQAAMLTGFGAMGNPCCHHTRDNVEQAIIDAIRALKN